VIGNDSLIIVNDLVTIATFSGPLEVDRQYDAKPGVDASLWCQQYGQYGAGVAVVHWLAEVRHVSGVSRPGAPQAPQRARRAKELLTSAAKDRGHSARVHTLFSLLVCTMLPQLKNVRGPGGHHVWTEPEPIGSLGL
jgi:hypothetical protein